MGRDLDSKKLPLRSHLLSDFQKLYRFGILIEAALLEIVRTFSRAKGKKFTRGDRCENGHFGTVQFFDETLL